jgi:predicted RNase H-like HicB family nuclease
MTDYHINMSHSDEDGGYIADIPDLRGARPSAALLRLP